MNIVLLVMDTARADVTTSVLSERRGSASFWTAPETMHFEAYSSAPWTVPSHASLLTGTTPSKHGAHAGHPYLEDTLTTLPCILSSHGYETVAVSNNTWISEEFGFGRGFETFYKTWQYVQSDTDLGRIAREHEGISKITTTTKALFDGNPLKNLTNAIYGQFFRKDGDDGAARTNEWVDEWLSGRDGSRPFFLFINYLEPHLEYRPPMTFARDYLPEDVTYEAAMDVSQDAWGYVADKVELTDKDFEVLRALYRAEIDYLTKKIEELVQRFKTAGEWEDTLLIVTSDHGENIGEHGLMDHQYALYDTLLHVPLIIHGGPFENSMPQYPLQLVDIPPTVLETLDIDAYDAEEQFQGISFHPDNRDTREYVLAEYMAPQPSMTALEQRVGDLPSHVRTYDRSLRAIRGEKYKYIRGSDDSQELYDIQIDPVENNDLADVRDDIAAELDSQLDEWLGSFVHADDQGDVPMDDDTRARLEDLGYLQ